MALVGDDQNGLWGQSWVPIDSDEDGGGQFPNQRLIDGRIGEVEVVDILGERQLGDAELVANGAGLLLGDIRLEETAEDAGQPWEQFSAFELAVIQLLHGY
ncbi:hypothetical protein HT585_23140 [Ensifer sp. HO-A22]|uniref:Uncharacterized protein n=1 Tax=Ensifer oleiphilus TaxID=2742698 RepID=A0A7Y6Q9Z3_9HYPH|nr:hypothetical protein [Ensifer oleiphilus]